MFLQRADFLGWGGGTSCFRWTEVGVGEGINNFVGGVWIGVDNSGERGTEGRGPWEGEDICG